jgi:hypothetical protein
MKLDSEKRIAMNFGIADNRGSEEMIRRQSIWVAFWYRKEQREITRYWTNWIKGWRGKSEVI